MLAVTEGLFFYDINVQGVCSQSRDSGDLHTDRTEVLKNLSEDIYFTQLLLSSKWNQFISFCIFQKKKYFFTAQKNGRTINPSIKPKWFQIP